MKLDPRQTLQFRQEELKRQITAALDLLEGFVYKSPSQRGYHLTRSVAGRTRTKHVRKRLVPQVRAMVQNRRRVQVLLAQLSAVNWRLLHLPPED